ncbi:MAG: hypothetical protein R3A44_40280 [Caldilineaceae bacterium]
MGQKVTQHAVRRRHCGKRLLVALGRFFHAQTLNLFAEFDDNTVMDDAVNGGSRGERGL